MSNARKATIHVTDLNTYNLCNRRFRYQSILNLVPKEGKTMEKFDFGTAMHKGLETYYRSKMTKVPEKALSSSLDVFLSSGLSLGLSEEMLRLGRTMLENYALKYREYDFENVLHLETKFTTRIPGTYVDLIATYDMVVEVDGLYYIVDHKTYDRLPTLTQFDLDPQFTGYLWIAEKMGMDIAGVIVNVLRKKIAVQPRLLNSGTLSVAKNDCVSYETYLEAIKAHGFNTEDYQEILEYYRQNSEPFFARYMVERTKNELDEYGYFLPETARNIVDRTNKYKPQPSYSCNYCPYREMCKMESCGDDYLSYMQETYFQTEGRNTFE